MSDRAVSGESSNAGNKGDGGKKLCQRTITSEELLTQRP